MNMYTDAGKGIIQIIDWHKIESFTKLLNGIEKDEYAAGMVCPKSHARLNGNNKLNKSYGINSCGHLIDDRFVRVRRVTSDKTKESYVMSRVATPSQKLMIVDAIDWWVNPYTIRSAGRFNRRPHQPDPLPSFPEAGPSFCPGM